MADPFIGQVTMFAGSFAPRGWAFCHGQLLPISSNTALFSIIGTTYGGNGVSTFALPDLRGRSPIGDGAGPGLQTIMPGEKSGRETVTLLTPQLPPHTSTVAVEVAIPATTLNTNRAGSPSNTTVLGPVAAAGRDGTLYSSDAPNTSLKPFQAMGTTTPVGAGQPIDIRNPYQAINFII
ncbi:phage tail protein, partial [Rheinheimera baltica]|uniref:phage tail protein n=1 Tax=Rheinheimera baltica TaxID=67576 RepID=UPI00273F3D69